MKMIQPQQQVKVQQKQIWRCDICRIRTFPTFQEACDHEEICKESMSRQLDPTTPKRTDEIIATASLSPSSCSSSHITPYSSSQDTVEIHTSTTQKRRSEQPLKLKNKVAVMQKSSKSRQLTIDLTESDNSKFNRIQQQSIVPNSTKEILELFTKQKSPKTVSVSVIIGGKTAHVIDAELPILVTKTIPRTKRLRDHVGLATFTTTVEQTLVTENTKSKKLKKNVNTKGVLSTKVGKKSDNNKLTVAPSSSSSACYTSTLKEWRILPKDKKCIIDVDSNDCWIGAVQDEENNQSNHKFINEQMIAYQFMEERRRKRQLEQEKKDRQKARQELEEEVKLLDPHKEIQIKNTGTTILTTVPDRSKSISLSNRHTPAVNVIPQMVAAVRFPSPSHVIPADSTNETEKNIKRGRSWWNNKSLIQQPDTIKIHQSPTSTRINTPRCDDVLHGSSNLLQEVIRRCIMPPPHNSSTAGKLLVHRYYDNTTPDIPQSSNYTKASKQIHNFIERFMIERQKVERAAKEKLNKQRQNFFGVKRQTITAKSKPSTYRVTDDDDYLWDDDDCTNSNFEYNTDHCSNLCVVSGPIGCGKSNLIHHTTKQLGCRKVVELHTGMKRNAAAIKRIVEEATKSHSTFDMMQNQKEHIKSNSSSKVTQQQNVSKSIEVEGKSPNDEFMDERGSAVTVILIDEVDNLDPNTDHGFWTALCDLCKESKCPIILTCNDIPNELLAMSSLCWTHVPMERPSASECGKRLQEILAMEAFSIRDNISSFHSAIVDPLQTIAIVANCDMRRILQEIQVFQVVSPSVTSHISDRPNDAINARCTTEAPCHVDVDDMYVKACFASDSALFEDLGLNNSTVLSGACRGYGFDDTEDSFRRTNEKRKPPSEEQLILSGIKENSNFYGTSDSLVFRYLSRREKTLLQEYECMTRGRSPKYGGIHCEDGVDEFGETSTHQSDEDCLVCYSTPIVLLELPHILNTPSISFPFLLLDEHYNRRKQSQRSQVLKLLRESIFTHPKYTRFFGRLQKESLSCSNCSNSYSMLDSDIFLDYLPLLRCMAVQELILESFFHAQGCSYPDGSSDLRRSTRRSLKNGREQYFDKIVPFHARQQLTANANQATQYIVQELCDMSLSVITVPNPS